MKNLYLIFGLAFALPATIVSATDAMGKKARIVLLDAGVCKVDDRTDKTEVKVKDISKNQRAVNVTMDFPVDIDDKKVNVTAVLDKYSAGQWRPNYMSFIGPACEKTNEYMPGVIKKLAAKSDPKFDITCPWKKGTYIVKNFPHIVEPDDTKLPSYPYGRFKINFMFKEATGKMKKLFCMWADTEIKKP